jgi:hypothetical protein
MSKEKRDERKEERGARQEERQDERQLDLGQPGTPDLGDPGRPGATPEPPDVELLLEYVPKEQNKRSTGPMQAGQSITFGWRTPTEGIIEDGKNGGIFFTPPSDSNDTFTIVFTGAKDEEKSCPGPNSCSWGFGPDGYMVPMLPDTNYTGTIMAQNGGYALEVTLNGR